jgi:hypothetical protein
MVEKLKLKKIESLSVVLVVVLFVALIVPVFMIPFTSHKIVAAEATSSRDSSTQAAMNNPDNVVSAVAQGNIQCLGGDGSSYRSAQITFGVYKAGETMTGSFNIDSSTDSKSIIAGSIDGGQTIAGGDQYRMVGTTEGSSDRVICDGDNGSDTERNGGGGDDDASTTLNNAPVSSRITITGQCGQGATIQYRGANGQIGTFAGNVECNFTDSSENYNAPPSGNNQYQGEEEEYGDYRQSNEFRQGSQAFQQCIEAAADVGDMLSDYEIRNCKDDPSYRH